MAEQLQRSNIETALSEPLVPATAELMVLDTTERLGFSLTHRMNLGAWKRVMTFCQRHIGSLWIYLATYNLMNVFGIENVENAEVDTPLVLVANHRSFFDMYTVSSVIFRRTRRPVTLYFPVRAKFFYDNPVGWFVNFVMGWFSMYPPFFREARDARKREFDKYSMRRLIQLCSEGHGHMIGFHPEGKRNLMSGPYDFLPAQPGIGKVIGEHNGAHYYTIGQRKGLHLSGHSDRLFVIGTDTDNNIIYTGLGDEHPGLYRRGLFIDVKDEHWIRKDLALGLGESRACLARIRYRQKLEPCVLHKQKEGLYIVFPRPQRGVTAGQFAA